MTSDPFYVPDGACLYCEDCAPDDAERQEPSEADCPQSCDECGALLAGSLTTDGVRYVEDALRETIRAALFVRADGSAFYSGSAGVQDEWREEFGTALSDKLTSAYDVVRERQTAKLSVLLVAMEAGYGRASGTDSHGAFWTETEREEGHEDCAECGAQIRSGWLCLDGGELVCREHVLTPEDAKRIASEWHGGQDSELYKLASSGAVTSSAQFYADTELRALDCHVRRSVAMPGSPLARPQVPLADRWRERDKLRALAQWCEAVRSRGYADATLDIREAVARDGSSVHKLAQVADILRGSGLYVPERRTAEEERRTLPDFRTPDGRYLVCQAGAVLPDGRVIVAASARDAHTWHVLAMAPGSTTEPYYVASYVRPSDCRTPLRLGIYASLPDALADYLAR